MDISTRNRLYRQLSEYQTSLARQQKTYTLTSSPRTLEHINRLEQLINKTKTTIEEGVICDDFATNMTPPKKTRHIKVPDAPKKKKFITQEPREIKEKEFFRAQERIEKTSEKLPLYIQKKLKTMPNNEGYTFRGMIFLGEKPSNGENITILDTSNKDEMTITTYTPDFEFVYLKKREAYKKLISKKPRVKKNSTL